jgi:hypothetical protein
MMAMRRTAALPIAMPVMPPDLSFPDTVGAATAMGDTGPPVLVLLGIANLVEIEVTVVGPLLAAPFAVKFEYA